MAKRFADRLDLRLKLESIVTTGYASGDTPVRSIRYQVSDYLFKPFSLQYFLGAVARTLHGEQGKSSTQP